VKQFFGQKGPMRKLRRYQSSLLKKRRRENFSKKYGGEETEIGKI